MIQSPRTLAVLLLSLSHSKGSGNTAGLLIGVSEAAERLGVSRQRVLQMIADGRMPAQRVGRSWSINEVDVSRRRANLIVHAAMIVPKISPLVIAADLSDYRAGREDRKSHPGTR